MNSIDIFPWNDNFNTGIEIVDQQHQRLVLLLNRLASHLAFQTDLPALDDIFDELAAYAVYHFQSEEAIWHAFLPADVLEAEHKAGHEDFVKTIEQLKNQQGTQSVERVIEELLAYLARWLASHILENDRHMALIVQGMQAGASAEQAKIDAKLAIDCNLKVLIDIILSSYSSLTRNTLQMMRELVAHKRDLEFLRKLSLAVDQSPSSIIITDINANIEFVNDSFLKVTGYSRAEVIGQNPRILKSGQTPDAIYKAMWETLSAGEVWEGELINKRKDGSLYTEHAIISPIFQAEGNPSHFLAIKEDITARKQAEIALKQSEEKFRSIFEYSNDALMFMKGDCYVDGNSSSLAMFGVESVEALKGLTPVDLSPTFQSDGSLSVTLAKGQIDKAYSDGFSRFDWLHRRKDGEEFAAEVGLYAFKLQNETVLLANVRDISERKRAEKQLAESEYKYHSLIDLAGDAIFIIDAATGLIIDCNRSASNLLGRAKSDIINSSQTTLHPDNQFEHYQRLINEHIVSGKAIAEDMSVQHQDGRIIPVDITATMIELGGNPVILGVFRDITKRKQVEDEMRIAATAFDTQQGMLITNANREIVRINKTFTEISGYSANELLGNNPRILSSGLHDADFYADMWRSINASGVWQGEIWDRRKSGEVYPVNLTVTAVRDKQNNITNYVATHSDITQLKQHQVEIEHIAYHDPLTQLPNRRLLADRMGLALSRAKRTNESVAIVCIDLDGFKEVNDTFGHDAGDQLLIEAAHRMQHCVRTEDTVSRLGGDEFVLLLGGISNRDDCEVTLRRVLGEMTKPFNIGDTRSICISGSIGYTLFPEDTADADTLLRHADHAMYGAKQSGKNRFHRFDLKQDNRVTANWGALTLIEKALENGEFRLFIQPKVSLLSGQVVGAEALIRWQHPIRGLVYPVEFLALLEKHELSIKLGHWVICEGMRILHGWVEQGIDLTLSVNVSARQLRESDFSSKLAATLQEFQSVPPRQLEIEIVESAALDDISKVSTLIMACRALGVRFSLDDFGTGYSSLTYLNRLAVDTLKIDQTFVRDMLDDDNALAIVRGVIGLARAFNNETVAEGVETWPQAAKLKAMGCGIIQGYAVAKPMPAENFPAWLTQFQMPDLKDYL